MNCSKLCSLLILPLIIVGCASPTTVQDMTPQIVESQIDQRHDATVVVRVSGGDGKYITSEKYTAALVNAIQQSQVFSSASSSGPADYELIVVIFSAVHSWSGNSMDVSTRWMLRDSGGKDVWTADIEGRGESNTLGGAVRKRESVERATSDSIGKGVSSLSKVSL